MLVNSKVLLDKAQRERFAIPSANVLDMESIKNHIQLAEKLGHPLIRLHFARETSTLDEAIRRLAKMADLLKEA